jgi:hypothetical protein
MWAIVVSDAHDRTRASGGQRERVRWEGWVSPGCRWPATAVGSSTTADRVVGNTLMKAVLE